MTSLPTLTGTTSQIAKAEVIRNRILNSNFRSAKNADWFRQVAELQTLAFWYISTEKILNSLVDMAPRKENTPTKVRTTKASKPVRYKVVRIVGNETYKTDYTMGKKDADIIIVRIISRNSTTASRLTDCRMVRV